VALVVSLQLGALALLALRPARAIASGREITLRTRAVDPFDPLAGRYVVLRYEIEDTPPSPDAPPREGEPAYLVVEHAELAWTGVSVGAEPAPATPTRLSLRVTWRAGRASLEQAGRLYLNEEQCLEADELLRLAPREGLVDLAVDEEGNATPRRLHIAGRVFGR
jgi:hypothetical protein